MGVHSANHDICFFFSLLKGLIAPFDGYSWLMPEMDIYQTIHDMLWSGGFGKPLIPYDLDRFACRSHPCLLT
jgi:hypothetical protein